MKTSVSRFILLMIFMSILFLGTLQIYAAGFNIDFKDTKDGEYPVVGEYKGINWDSPKEWTTYTHKGIRCIYANAPEKTLTLAQFKLPSGKTLKQFKVANASGGTAKLKLITEQNEIKEIVVTGDTFTSINTNWQKPSGLVKIELLNEVDGAWDTLFTDFVYIDSPSLNETSSNPKTSDKNILISVIFMFVSILLGFFLKNKKVIQ